MKISAIPAARVGTYNLFVLDGAEPHMIGTLIPGSARRAEQIKKDLDLMTAAPDLLEAAKEALEALNRVMPNIVMDAKDSLRMAIAKAEA